MVRRRLLASQRESGRNRGVSLFAATVRRERLRLTLCAHWKKDRIRCAVGVVLQDRSCRGVDRLGAMVEECETGIAANEKRAVRPTNRSQLHNLRDERNEQWCLPDGRQ
jgi:hypothetical protein